MSKKEEERIPTQPRFQIGNYLDISVNAGTLCTCACPIKISSCLDLSYEHNYIIDLSNIDISYNKFRNIFYSDNTHFNPISSLQAFNQDLSRYILNSNQDLSLNNITFNLYKECKKYYESTYLNSMNQWSSTSITNFQKQFAKQKTLLDIGNGCNYCCGMTLNELFEAWELDFVPNPSINPPLSAIPPNPPYGYYDLSLRGTPYITPDEYRVPYCNNWVWSSGPGSTPGRPPAYKIPCTISALIKNTTMPDISNIQINWNYAIDFSGVYSRYRPETVSRADTAGLPGL